MERHTDISGHFQMKDLIIFGGKKLYGQRHDIQRSFKVILYQHFYCLCLKS